MPAPLRVTLKWIQITDNLEPGRDKEGEFVFRTRVETDAGAVVETRLPEEGSWFISQKPGKNRVKLDEVVFEGEAGSRLVVELTGEEQDRLTGSDSLETYRREFTGEPSSWAGLHRPGDEGDADPENLSNWRIGYEIELI
jgi:hypothetical protein